MNPIPENLILKSSSHATPDEGMCVMEAVAFVAGEPHSDHPRCASPALGGFLRSLNDRMPDDETRTKYLAPLIPHLVGSRGDNATENVRRWAITDWALRRRIPVLFREVGFDAYADRLAALPEIKDDATAREARAIAREARAEASARRNNAWAKIHAAAADAADAPAYAAYAAAADAADAAYAAAADAADAAAYAAADAADAAAAAAEPSVIQKIVEAAKSGGYRSARMVADELIGAPLRARWGPIREQGYVDACALVVRLAAKEDGRG